MSTLKIEMLGGNCPVQAEGTVAGRPFYFRARGERWRMQVHPTVDSACPYIDWPEDELEAAAAIWERSAEWGDGPFAAGWMPEEEARAIIEKCAAEYEGEINNTVAPGAGADYPDEKDLP